MSALNRVKTSNDLVYNIYKWKFVSYLLLVAFMPISRTIC